MQKDTEKSETYQVLRDLKKDGKERPWRDKKMRSLKVAKSFARQGDNKKRADRVWNCGTYLVFQRNVETGERRLKSANFCRERLCPMCQWHKTAKMFQELSRVIDSVSFWHNNLIPLFLTLTIKNCKADESELSMTFNMISGAWKRLSELKRFEDAVHGWFRALEITYNKDRDEFHPHIHAVILVDKSYFKNSITYIETTEWVQLWRTSLRVDYDPICDIRKIKNHKSRRKGIAEVTKYAVKDTDYVTCDNTLTDRLIGILSKSLKGRRLHAYGGILRRIVLEIRRNEQQIDADDDTIRQDVAVILEQYHWHFGLINYISHVKK